MEKQTIMNNFKNTDLPFIGTKHYNFKNLTMNTSLTPWWDLFVVFFTYAM